MRAAAFRKVSVLGGVRRQPQGYAFPACKPEMGILGTSPKVPGGTLGGGAGALEPPPSACTPRALGGRCWWKRPDQHLLHGRVCRRREERCNIHK